MVKTLVALPALNEGPVIGKVVKDLKKAGLKNILVVDDGSTDNTVTQAKRASAQTVSHPFNRGAGAATATGLEYARRNNYDYVIFMDSDGQHSPQDAKKLLAKAEKYDVVIGSRLLNAKGMPFMRKAYNAIGSFITWIFFGLYVRDSQSGFKVLNKKAMNKISITYDSFEFCSEIIGEIKKHKLSYIEVPIKVIYTKHSLSKGQSFLNGVKMLWRFILRV